MYFILFCILIYLFNLTHTSQNITMSKLLPKKQSTTKSVQSKVQTDSPEKKKTEAPTIIMKSMTNYPASAFWLQCDKCSYKRFVAAIVEHNGHRDSTERTRALGAARAHRNAQHKESTKSIIKPISNKRKSDKPRPSPPRSEGTEHSDTASRGTQGSGNELMESAEQVTNKPTIASSIKLDYPATKHDIIKYTISPEPEDVMQLTNVSSSVTNPPPALTISDKPPDYIQLKHSPRTTKEIKFSVAAIDQPLNIKTQGIPKAELFHNNQTFYAFPYSIFCITADQKQFMQIVTPKPTIFAVFMLAFNYNLIELRVKAQQIANKEYVDKTKGSDIRGNIREFHKGVPFTSTEQSIINCIKEQALSTAIDVGKLDIESTYGQFNNDIIDGLITQFNTQVGLLEYYMKYENQAPNLTYQALANLFRLDIEMFIETDERAKPNYFNKDLNILIKDITIKHFPGQQQPAFTPMIIKTNYPRQEKPKISVLCSGINAKTELLKGIEYSFLVPMRGSAPS
jgi:hypothetical protein